MSEDYWTCWDTLCVTFRQHGWKGKQIRRYFPSAMDGAARTHVHVDESRQI